MSNSQILLSYIGRGSKCAIHANIAQSGVEIGPYDFVAVKSENFKELIKKSKAGDLIKKDETLIHDLISGRSLRDTTKPVRVQAGISLVRI